MTVTMNQAKAAHGRLREIIEEMLGIGTVLARGRPSSDVMFALGQAAGLTDKAAGLLGRDIDDERFENDP